MRYGLKYKWACLPLGFLRIILNSNSIQTTKLNVNSIIIEFTLSLV